jgi:hypothetical protein
MIFSAELAAIPVITIDVVISIDVGYCSGQVKLAELFDMTPMPLVDEKDKVSNVANSDKTFSHEHY